MTVGVTIYFTRKLLANYFTESVLQFISNKYIWCVTLEKLGGGAAISRQIENILENLKNQKVYKYGIFLWQFQSKKTINTDVWDLSITFKNSCSFSSKISKLEGDVYSISKSSFEVFMFNLLLYADTI